MMIAIHQPHYFPWLGYLAKMASVEKFILMDTVQLEKRSYMHRNRIVNLKGEIKYLNILAEKHNHFEREYRDIRTKDFEEWTGRQKGILIDAYKKSPWFDEIWNAISPIFHVKNEFLCDTTINSIKIVRDILDIKTPMILQSCVEVDESLKKSDLILGICKAVSADVYYSGNGAKNYMNDAAFESEGIHVVYQKYRHPVYSQIGEHPFVAGLSVLDLLFNNGIVKSRDIFWNSII